MKNFITKYKKIIMFSVIVFILAALLTTTAVTTPKKSYLNRIDDIVTCSVPEGKIKAMGIDVSRYQGDIDFQKVKSAGYDFAILRVGTSKGGKDQNFETYYKNAADAGLDIGCYYYTYAITFDEAKKEAKEVLEYIDGKTFNYPVFFDFEYPEFMSFRRVNENTKMINVFCKYIKRGGYYPGVYTSNSIYNNYINSGTIGSKWDVWIANYRDNTYNYKGFSFDYSMWQYTNAGTVDGIDAYVDLNVCYVDYPKIISDFKDKLLEIQ